MDQINDFYLNVLDACGALACRFIEFVVRENLQPTLAVATNALQAMMDAATKTFLPGRKEQSNAKNVLFNDILKYIRKNAGCGWTRGSIVSLGVPFVEKLTDIFWAITTHHPRTMAKAGPRVPPCFDSFKERNDYKTKKEQAPRLSQAILGDHITMVRNFKVHAVLFVVSMVPSELLCLHFVVLVEFFLLT